MRVQLASLLAIVLAAASAPAYATVYEVAPGDDVAAAIDQLAPGDELVVHGGTYTLTARFTVDVVGTEAQPIVIRAKDGERPIFHRPNAAQNVWDVDRAEYVAIRGLELSGGSAGLRIVAAKHLTIEGCEIHDTGDVALRANDTGSRYEALRILRNHIHHTNDTGEGMYLGCNANACQMFDSLIEGNYVHHTNGPTVVQGDGIEVKEGSYNNIIRDNVIHDTNYPCILTYSTVGNGAPNIIERNVMWGCGDHAIQSAADAVIRNNIILGSVAHGIAMQPHQSGSPANLTVVHNTVLHATNDAIRATNIVGTVVIANNALYAQSGRAIVLGGTLTDVTVAGNVGVGGRTGGAGGIADGNLSVDFIAASYEGAPPNDVFPAAGSALIGAGVAAHVTSDDFNGTPRDGIADAGAYKLAAGGNPGWTIMPGFKDVVSPPVTGDGDPSVTGDGGTGNDDPAGGAGCGCSSGDGNEAGVLALVVIVVVRRRYRRNASSL